MELKGKKVLVVGLGKSGLAAALFLRRRGAQVTVSDVRSAAALAHDIPALLDQGIMVEAGGHGLLTFRRQDLIVVSPGVPLDTPELVQVRNFGLPVIGELELAARFLAGKTIAITGSNGKTTTTSLCGEILAAAHLHVQVGGNIGLPVIALVDQSREDGWSVLEVSSFQLETTYQFHPNIAAILNVTPDHLDRHGNMENYVAAKERIFANQGSDDALILNADDDAASRAAARAKSQVFWFSRTRIIRQGAFVREGAIYFRASEQSAPEFILKVGSIPLKGQHNVENVLAAICAARLAGVAPDAIRGAVEHFHAVEHRLEFVASLNGVDYYNDSKATNVDAALKAIAAFPSGIHLILGGKDKNSDYRLMRPLIQERVKAIYTIGAAAEKIITHVEGSAPIVNAGTLDIAVAKAAEAAQSGEIVLLAPACSSFDQFQNYEQRGQVFKDLVLARRGLPEWQNA
ncbi:MAG TPA: UDP-N-acetylmuramoyl-L-alanine--D-glutamate ligase [Silvibacterium sp.]|nr:UDP-N-acetylmuramoyl-L-alanine--D-glutamate ligase [Silvibacterium sp.]